MNLRLPLLGISGLWGLSLLPAKSLGDPSELEGYYRSGHQVIEIEVEDGRVFMARLVGSGRALLTVDGDEASFSDNHESKLSFRRSQGRVAALEVHSAGITYDRVALNEAPALVALLEGRFGEAIDKFAKEGLPKPEIVGLAERIATSRPNQSAVMERFARYLLKQPAPLEGAEVLLARAIMNQGRKAEGIEVLKSARPTPATETAISSMLRIAKADSGTHAELLDVMLKPPTEAEIQEVRSRWSKRDLSPKSVRLEKAYDLGGGYEARVFSHAVHGQKHYGSVIRPKDASKRSCAVILELKGVSPDYFPLTLPGGLTSRRILAPYGKRFVFASPCLRGERMLIGGDEYRSEGNPDDSWDGAADDSIAFLNVVLQEVPEADSRRVATFGRSRGGTLAMLVAERDRRIDRVYSWSGPAGWIENMTQQGWNLREQVAYGLTSGSSPTGLGGQWIRTFASRVITGEETLADARRRVVASSPIYFVDALPLTEAHYGMEDPIVVASNGSSLESASGAKGVSERVRVIYHARGGHDLDAAITYPTVTTFFLGLADKANADKRR